MYHTDVILHFRHVFDKVKSICERCSLWNFAYSYISSTMCNFKICFSPKKTKYHVCVILSRLCDTLNGLEDQVSRRRDSITQTWYFDFLREKQFLKLDIVEKGAGTLSSRWDFLALKSSILVKMFWNSGFWVLLDASKGPLSFIKIGHQEPCPPRIQMVLSSTVWQMWVNVVVLFFKNTDNVLTSFYEHVMQLIGAYRTGARNNPFALGLSREHYVITWPMFKIKWDFWSTDWI